MLLILLHERRYAASNLLSCHNSVVFAIPFSHLKAYFTFIQHRLLNTPLLAHSGGQQGGIMSRIMYTKDINTAQSIHVFRMYKAATTLIMQHMAKMYCKLQNRTS